MQNILYSKILKRIIKIIHDMFFSSYIIRNYDVQRGNLFNKLL